MPKSEIKSQAESAADLNAALAATPDVVDASLSDCLEDWVEDLLGSPNGNLGNRSEWRWGRNGSLRLYVSGASRGRWKDFESGEGGGPLDLVRRELGPDRAIPWAVKALGGEIPSSDLERERKREERRQKAEAEQAVDDARRIAIARWFWAEAVTPASSPADRYLTTTRGIPRPFAGWPDAVRFHKPSGSLILAATTTDGEVRAVQRVRLSLDGRKHPQPPVAYGAPAGVSKPTNGALAGAAVRLPGPVAGPLLIAEGPETGLSVWAATGFETWIALGSMAYIKPPAGRRIVICRDDDAPFSPADLALNKRLSSWIRDGTNFVLASPWAECRGDKSDFNDVIKTCGPEAVRARIEAAQAPRKAARRSTVTEGRAEVERAVVAFLAAAAVEAAQPAVTPTVHAVCVDLGVGKSSEARRQVAGQFLPLLRSRADQRVVVFAVPTVKLAEEQAAAFNDLATRFTAATWRGRRAPDPDAPGETMCRDLEAVRAAREVYADVDATCCRSKKRQCQFYDACGYQQQKKQEADVWFVAHELLFTKRPKAVGEVAALIVDEAAWQAGLIGASGSPVTIPLDALRTADNVEGDVPRTNLLRQIRDKAVSALDSLSDGPVRRAALVAAGLTEKEAAGARGLEWSRKVKPAMHPDMSATERREAAAVAVGNRTIGRLAMWWDSAEALLAGGGPAASGWATLKTDKNGARVLVLKARRQVSAGWSVPTLILDATLMIDLVRPYWPQVQLTADVRVETPHQRVRQVVDESFSKNRLAPPDRNKPAPAGKELVQQGTRDRHRRDLHATLAAIVRNYAPGRVLVVAQKAIESALDPLPPNVALEHHNNVAGRDEWKDVTALVVVGRTAPTPKTVEQLAEALTGAASEELIKNWWYPSLVTEREMVDGTIVPAVADRHPDPIAEAIRWHICVGELLQIIGRARGVNRTRNDPVDVWVLTDVPLPLAVAQTLRAADLEPGPGGLMLAAGGIAFESPADAARAYPQLWPTPGAAKAAFFRARTGLHSPIDDLLIGVCNRHHLGVHPWTYHRAGRGQKPARAWVYRPLVADPAAALAALLGRLAFAKPG